MNLTCAGKNMLLIAAAAAVGGAGGWYWKKTKGGIGGAAAGGILAYLLVAQCGPDTIGPAMTQAATPDGTKTTTTVGVAASKASAAKAGTSKIGALLGQKAPSSTAATSLLSKFAFSPVARDPSLPVQPVRTVSSLLSGAGAKCSPGWTWSDSRGGCVYQTNVK